jgi:DNA repair exonuclease SbcCD nuclease subunit
MESVKVLHCADLHLGASFSSLPPRVAAERSNDLRRVFMRIIEICKTEKIRLLLIAGDLFDSVHIPDSLSDMVRNAFSSIPGTFVAVTPGNHDPAVFDSPYRNKDIWPKNMIIFTDGFAYLDLPVINVRLWGAGFTHVYQDQPLFMGSRFTDTKLLNICVMHGDLVQTGGSSAYNPITADMIAESGMDYWALGHVHKCSEIRKAGNVFYAYPGSPEGLGFDEKGERGVYMGEITRGICDMRFYAVNTRAYVDIHIDATGLRRQEIIKLIRDKLRTDKTGAVDDLIRITMTGIVTEDSYVSPEYASTALSDVFYLNLNDQSQLDVNQDSGGRDFTLRHIFIRKMRERIAQNPSDESLKLAMKLGLRAFTEKVVYTGGGRG